MGNLFARGLGKGLLGAAIIATAVAVTPAWAETVINRGFGASPDTLDPHMNFGAREGWIQDDIYEGLTAGNEKGEMGPGAAESWETSDDGLTWTFHLRDGLKWSNGDPLVAQDFVNGVIRQLEPKTASPRAYYFSSLVPLVGGQEFIDAKDKGDPKTVGISAPDDKTIVMKLKSPQPNMLYLVESYHIPPLHKPSFDKYGADFIKPENIVSNGAYMMTENVPQSHVTLVKNPNYWNAASVKIDKVVYVVTEDDQTELKRYKAGELETTNEIPSDQLDAVKEEFGDQVRITPYLESQYISFNITKPPFDNIRVRQALAIGIDRKVLQDKIVKAGYQYNCGYTPPNDPRYHQPQVPECGMTKEERSTKGRQLLADAGFGPDNPLKVTIETSSDNTAKKLAEGVALMWKQNLGVDAKVNAQEFQAWMNTFYSGGWDVLNDNLIGDMPGPESHLAYMRPSAESGYNWKSPAFESLMDEASQQASIEERYKILAQAEKVLLDYYLVTPLDVTTSRHLVKPTVKGWEDNILDTHPSKLMSIAQ
ncbi:MAG TPA: peptide ABC transporter substrate-binding protein [Dongiaceae bacterium]|nr:peptide ABC transporter substrate-binding protein [Dongiaceae bacterium]